MERRLLQLEPAEFRVLFRLFGPSLGLWRAAEIAVLRQQVYHHPILDLGCGDGLVTSFVLKKVDYGLDPDASDLQKAARLKLYSNVIARDMQSADLPDASISTIMSNSVLEHIPQIDQVLSTAARVLTPGGQLIFTVPSDGFSSSLLFPGKSYAARRNRFFQHVNIWPLDAWRSRLDQAGFDLVKSQPYFNPAWVRLWDALELMQMVYLGKTRLFGIAWRKLPEQLMAALSRRAGQLDLSAAEPGGGRLIVATRREPAQG